MKRYVFLIYVVFLHLAIAILLLHPKLASKFRTQLGIARPRSGLQGHFDRMLSFHKRSLEMIPRGSVILIGDSLIQGLYVNAVSPKAVDFGISGDTTVGVLQRLGVYEPVTQEASVIILAIGVNDLRHRPNDEIAQNYEQILDALPSVPIKLSSILPVDELAEPWLGGYSQRILAMNDVLRSLAEARSNVTYIDNDDFLDTNNDQRLDPNFHIGDGLHLNSTGNARWAESLKRAISNH